MIKENIITLCGSTKFKLQYEEVNRNLSLMGKVVLSVSCFGHADNLNLTARQKDLLDSVHLRKIDLAEAIFVINVDGYIGKSTMKEISYAMSTGKKVYFLCKPREYIMDKVNVVDLL